MERFKFRVLDTKGEIHSRRLKVINGEVYIYFIIDNRYEYQKDQKRFIIVQCTGLKDKNGTLIYEGDVVKYENEKYQIIFELGCFMIARQSNNTDMYKFKNCWNDNCYPLVQLYFDNDCDERILSGFEIMVTNTRIILNNEPRSDVVKKVR